MRVLLFLLAFTVSSQILAQGDPQRPAASDSTASARQEEVKEDTVYVAKEGKKYHQLGCRHLSKGSIAIPLKEAVKLYGPCKRCYIVSGSDGSESED